MRLAFAVSYVFSVRTQRWERTSRTERAKASKRWRASAVAGSITSSKSR